MTDTGLYDLDRFHDAYWQRLDNLLALAKARDIIVQIELWDPHDYYRPVGDLGGWAQQPFNAANNVNYARLTAPGNGHWAVLVELVEKP